MNEFERVLWRFAFSAVEFIGGVMRSDLKKEGSGRFFDTIALVRDISIESYPAAGVL